MPKRRLRARLGANLIEVLVAAAVAGTVMLALGGFITSTFKATNNDRDRTFAQQKALQMMEELASYKSTDVTDNIDQFANGYNFALTTEKDAPIHLALSGNPTLPNKPNGYYKFVRDVNIESVPGDPYARRVTVRVFYADPRSATPTPQDPSKPLAVVTNLLRSSSAATGPRQVFDVYAISIDNLPHMFRKTDDDTFFPSTKQARLHFNAALAKIQSLNSGIEFRVHYITRLAEGRDSKYRPYINQGMSLHNDPSSSARDPINRLYFYPGTIGQGQDNDPYFDPDGMNGFVSVGDTSGVGTGVGGYPMADQFNHAVRYPAEHTFTASTDVFGAPKIPNGRDGTTPLASDDLSLRQFLDDLTAGSPDKYRNAIVVNLHGELFPLIPLRNYADPAKDPSESNADKRKRRVVTHPNKLVYSTAEDVSLMMYPFMEDGGYTPTSSITGTTDKGRFVKIDWPAGDYSTDVRIIVKGIKPYIQDRTNPLVAGDINDVNMHCIQRVRQNAGNEDTKYEKVYDWPMSLESSSESASGRKDHSGPHVEPHSNAEHHGGTALSHGTDPSWSSGSPWTTLGSGNDLVIHVTDVDYDARRTAEGSVVYGVREASTGVPDGEYLPHRLQYFPDPFLPLLHLANGDTKPRNSARLIINFPITAAAAGKKFEVETQLKKSTGWPTGEDPAISRTWFYVDAAWSLTKKLYWDDTTKTPTIPWTEQVQLVGDPRHNPYLDVRMRGLYNPYFSDFRNNKSVYYKDLVKNDTGTPSTGMGLETNDFAGTLEQAPLLGLLNRDVSYPGTRDSWKGLKVDVPAYLRMWRHAILRNNMVFVNASGAPLRFIGMGGEFKIEKKVNDIGDLHMSKKPYNGDASADANGEADELMGDNARFLERTSGDKWYSKPWIGELYPNDQAGNWNSYGNIPSGSGIMRTKISDLDNWSYATDKTAANNRRKVTDEVGLASFINGEDTVATTGPVNFDGGGSKGSQTATGKDAADALRQKLITGIKASWGYKLAGADAADTPPEWSDMSGERLTLDWLNAGEAPSGYYTQDQGSDYFAANPILLADSASASTSEKAIFLPVTARPDKATDVAKILEMVGATMLSAYFDGTNSVIGANRMRPVPRVKITDPVQGGTVPDLKTLTWYTKWSKVDGTEYSPFYTFNVGTAPTIVHFLKYKATAGTWKFADGTTAEIGVPGPSTLEIANQTYPTACTFAWNSSSLAPGEYQLRIEAFRKIGGVVQRSNYAYHQLSINLD